MANGWKSFVSIAVLIGGAYGASGCSSQSCVSMQAQWEALVDSAPMRACEVSSDCEGVGGQPLSDPCGGHANIGGCGRAANAQAYNASAGPKLEASFQDKCPDSRAYDCGPVVTECVQGACVAHLPGCYAGKKDAAVDRNSERLYTPVEAGTTEP